MDGGDMLFKDYKFSVSNNDGNRMLYKSIDKENSISLFFCYMILMNSCLATDQLGMPYLFRTGIIKAFLIGLIAVLMTQASFHAFIRTWSFDTENSYQEIWSKCFGKKFKFIPQILLFLSLTVVSVGIASKVQSDLDNIMSTFVDEGSILRNDKFQTYFIALVVIAPLFFCKQITGLRFISLIANIGVIVSSICVIINMVICVKKEGIHKEKIVLWDNSWDTTRDCYSALNGVFFVHPFIPLVAPFMENCSRNKVLKLSWLTTLSTCAICLLTGLFGYFIYYGEGGKGNIIFSFDPHSPITIIGKIGSYVSTMFTSAIYDYVIGDYVAGLFIDRYKNREQIPLFLSGLVVICFNIAFNYIGQRALDIFNVIGNFAFYIIAFILPTIYYLYMDKFKTKSWTLFCIGGTLAASVIYFYLISYNIKKLL